jgi:16S rRNA (uracil1498-N3)-methyltransferase
VREVRIYQAGKYKVGQLIELSAEAGRHVSVVLRMQPGHHLTLFSGNNQEFSAEIITINKKKVSVKILTCQELSRESPCSIHLAQAISKGDRMEMVVQKAVELGVASITPLMTERCVVKLDKARLEKKCAQWQAIAIAACEQSGRNKIPFIHPIISLKQYLEGSLPSIKFVLAPNGEKTLRDFGENRAEVGLLIGPEGGLSIDELNTLITHQFAPLNLGPRILRTETAAIVALSVLQAMYGDL